MTIEFGRAADEYLSYCRFHKNLSPLSLKSYQIDLRQYGQFIRSKQIPSALEKNHIKNFIKALFKRRLKESSIRRKLISLKAFASYLENEGILKTNPFPSLRISLRVPYRIPVVMTIEEVRSIIETPKTKLSRVMECSFDEIKYDQLRKKRHVILLRDTVLLELLFMTGMRVTEVSQLNISDIDLGRRVIRVNGKGSKQRIIPLTHRDVLKLLTALMNNNTRKNKSEIPLFVNRRGKRLSSQSMRLLVTKYVRRAGITKKITPHTFRHTTATLLLEQGTDIRIVQTLLGHASITMTERYTHITPFIQSKIISLNHPRNLF